MTTAAEIHVRFRMEGLHHWPDAPTHRGYLAMEHRHLFHVEVSTTVKHDDREIEFHDLRDDAIVAFVALYVGGASLGSLSCEAIARAIGRSLGERYSRVFRVSVWEDGECGATVLA